LSPARHLPGSSRWSHAPCRTSKCCQYRRPRASRRSRGLEARAVSAPDRSYRRCTRLLSCMLRRSRTCRALYRRIEAALPHRRCRASAFPTRMCTPRHRRCRSFRRTSTCPHRRCIGVGPGQLSAPLPLATDPVPLVVPPPLIAPVAEPLLDPAPLPHGARGFGGAGAGRDRGVRLHLPRDDEQPRGN
jgi:hypothetical protein